MYVPNISSASDVCCIQVFHISEVESHGAQPRRRGMGRGEPWAGGRGTQRTSDHAIGACSSSCRLSGAARPEIEEGVTGEEWWARRFPAGARAFGFAVAEREEGAKGKERQAQPFTQVCMTMVAWASRHALLSGGASISQWQSGVLA